MSDVCYYAHLPIMVRASVRCTATGPGGCLTCRPEGSVAAWSVVFGKENNHYPSYPGEEARLACCLTYSQLVHTNSLQQNGLQKGSGVSLPLSEQGAASSCRSYTSANPLLRNFTHTHTHTNMASTSGEEQSPHSIKANSGRRKTSSACCQYMCVCVCFSESMGIVGIAGSL